MRTTFYTLYRYISITYIHGGAAAAAPPPPWRWRCDKGIFFPNNYNSAACSDRFLNSQPRQVERSYIHSAHTLKNRGILSILVRFFRCLDKIL